jgi:hypothetical protein
MSVPRGEVGRIRFSEEPTLHPDAVASGMGRERLDELRRAAGTVRSTALRPELHD